MSEASFAAAEMHSHVPGPMYVYDGEWHTIHTIADGKTHREID